MVHQNQRNWVFRSLRRWKHLNNMILVLNPLAVLNQCNLSQCLIHRIINLTAINSNKTIQLPNNNYTNNNPNQILIISQFLVIHNKATTILNLNKTFHSLNRTAIPKLNHQIVYLLICLSTSMIVNNSNSNNNINNSKIEVMEDNNRQNLVMEINHNLHSWTPII